MDGPIIRGMSPRMSIGTFRELVDRLGMSSRALAAVGAAVQARVTGTPLNPAIQVHIDDVLDALDARQLIDQISPAELRPLLGGIRSELFLGAQLVSGNSPEAAWAYTAPMMLQAAGDVS